MKNIVSILAAACFAVAAAPAFSQGMGQGMRNDAMEKDKMGKDEKMGRKHKAKKKMEQMDKMEKPDGGMAKDKMGK